VYFLSPLAVGRQPFSHRRSLIAFRLLSNIAYLFGIGYAFRGNFSEF
jgi:hypothetical protein